MTVSTQQKSIGFGFSSRLLYLLPSTLRKLYDKRWKALVPRRGSTVRNTEGLQVPPATVYSPFKVAHSSVYLDVLDLSKLTPFQMFLSSCFSPSSAVFGFEHRPRSLPFKLAPDLRGLSPKVGPVLSRKGQVMVKDHSPNDAGHEVTCSFMSKIINFNASLNFVVLFLFFTKFLSFLCVTFEIRALSCLFLLYRTPNWMQMPSLPRSLPRRPR